MGGALTHHGLSGDTKPANRQLKFLTTPQLSIADPPPYARSPEVIRQILSHLGPMSRGRMAQLCSSWKAIAEESWMWAGDEAQVRLPEHSGPALDCIRRRGIRKVKVLFLDGRPSEHLRGLLQALPRMQSLNLAPCKRVLDDNVFKALVEAQPFTSLTSLDLGSCSGLTDYSVGCIVKLLPNLEDLNLGFCTLIKDDSVVSVAGGLRKLKALEMSGCPISDSGLWVLGTGVPMVSPLANQLESLTLASCLEVTSGGLCFLIEKMIHLVTLDVSKCPVVSDAVVEATSKIPTLKRLVLSWCRMLTNTSMRSLATRPSSLEQLEMSDCVLINDEGASYIDLGPGLLELTTLYLRRNPITDNGLAKLARTLGHITKLDITMCKFITNAGVRVLADHLPKLRWLRMEHCTRLTNLMVKDLTRMGCLETLSIKGCRKVTGVGWMYAARSRVHFNIIELDVGFTGAGTGAVRFIAQCMPKLRSLILSGCPIKDGALSIVARHMPRLHTLRLMRCFLITDRGLDYLGLHHKELKVIFLTGCVLVTKTGKKNLAARLPHLAIQ